MMTSNVQATKPCPQFSEQMSLALDHQLGAAKERELYEHLRACAACQAQWDALQRVERLFTTAPLISPPTGFTARVSARLIRHESRQHIVFGALSLVAGALMLVPLALASAGKIVPPLYSLYLLMTTPAAWRGLLVVTELLSLVESVLNALRLTIVACIRSPGVIVCLTYNLAVLALTALWLRVLTSRLLRPTPISRQR